MLCGRVSDEAYGDILTTDAARVLAGGTEGNDCAIRLLKLAIREITDETTDNK
jgi:hypothetical protein